MSAGFHLDLYDYGGAQVLAEEAREAVRSASQRQRGDRPVPFTSAGIDLVLNFSRCLELGKAEDLLREVTESVEVETGGLHAWLFRLRLAEARAEFLLARGDCREALQSADEAIQLSRAKGRIKYEALALATRAQALIKLGRKKEAISDLRRAVDVTRPVKDPAMFLRAAAALLAVDGETGLAAEAKEAVDRTLAHLSDSMIRQRFESAEPVQLIYRLTHGKALRSLPTRPTLPDGLSEREVEVLRLIASGSSNREIADALILSIRTVERHIANVYTKTGIHSKAQATDYAHRHDLT